MVGILGVFQFTPILLLTLIAGTIIDRFSKRNILLITQSGFLCLGAIMTALVFFKIVQYWEILLIALGYGILQSFDNPTRQSFVFDLVGPKNLLNGISLNSSVFNLAKIIGPSIAGVLMAKFSIAWCFFIDACSYLAVLVGLFFVKDVPAIKTNQHQKLLPEIMEGLRYVMQAPEVRFSAELMLIICTLNFNMNVIIPVYAKTVLHAGAQVFANLLSAVGVGSLIAAFFMSYISKNGANRRLYLLISLSVVLSQTLMLLVQTYWLAIAIMVIIGFSNMIFLNQSNAAFQFSVPNELRGRVMSVYVLLNQGSTPLGSLYAGGIMDLTSGLLGFPACGGLALLLLIPVFWEHQSLIRIWFKKH